MAPKLLYPGISGSTAKQLVFEILCTDWPMSIAAIHGLLTRKYSHAISYQGVRFILGELVSEGVAAKAGKGYMLDAAWIE